MFSKKEKRFENKFIENLDFGTIIEDLGMLCRKNEGVL